MKKAQRKHHIAAVAPAKPTFVQDSMVNLMTGLGGAKDSSTYNQWVPVEYGETQLATIYKEHWLARKCVDVPVDETVSKWRENKTPGLTHEQIEIFEGAEKSLKLRKKIATALKWGRLFGGGALYLAVEGVDIGEPLRIDAIKKGARVNVIPFSRYQIIPKTDKIDGDEFSPNYGRPLFYEIRAAKQTVHASRVIVFGGAESPDSQISGEGAYWGLSIFDSSLIKAVERCESSMSSLAAALEHANIDAISIPELFEKLASTHATELLRRRIAEGALMRSVYKTDMIDSSEQLIRAEATGALGPGAAIVQMLLQVPSGATGIPVTKLLGTSPGGLNATGESDSTNYYDMLGEIRSNDIDEALEIIDKALCMSIFGRTFDDWYYEWMPFWSADKTEESTITATRINGIVQLVAADVLPQEVALRQIFEDGTYSALTEEVVKEFEDFAAEERDEPPPTAEVPAAEPETTEEPPAEVEEIAPFF